MDEPKKKPGSIFRRAFLNQYNFIMMAGAAAFAAATGSWLPAVVGAGAEILWLALGADSQAFRRWVARQESKEAREAAARDVLKAVAALEEHYFARYEDLRRMSDEIQALARENKGLETMLVQDEMAKLGDLLSSFVRMAQAHQRLGRYLREHPAREIEEDIARADRGLQREKDPRVQASLKQALALAQKRLKQQQQIEGAWKSLSVQMETLEKAFAYLKSHIVGITTREELAAELDNLVTGVASVAELDASTEELMQDLRGATASRRAATTR